MKEKLHTIPVNEAFEEDSECPLCSMYKALEDKAVDFTMGPSYMEDDVREATSRLGFCHKHLNQMYDYQNRLGLALILKSRMDKLIKEAEKHTGKIAVSSFFRKKEEGDAMLSGLYKLTGSCYICDRINATFERYVDTLFYLYQHEEEFRRKFDGCKGFCTEHYMLLHREAPRRLGAGLLKEFTGRLDTLYIENMKRVRDDLEWLINKFDYRYANEPWKNAKDALPRAMQKTVHL